MTIPTPDPLIEPLVRTLLGIPPSMVHCAPQSAQLKLHTVLLREAAFAKEVAHLLDDSCLMTVVDGQEQVVQQVKLLLPGIKKPLSGVHLALLSSQGQIQLTLGGDNLRLFLGAGCVVRGHFVLSQRSSVFIGDGTTMAQVRCFAANADLTIGDDCQFADEVLMQTHDQHPITDLRTGEVINQRRRRMKIGRHVWVGRRALLLPDVRIGDGAIVAAGAVVSSDVPAQSLASGSPARVEREQVGWAREFGKPPPVLAPANPD